MRQPALGGSGNRAVLQCRIKRSSSAVAAVRYHAMPAYGVTLSGPRRSCFGAPFGDRRRVRRRRGPVANPCDFPERPGRLGGTGTVRPWPAAGEATRDGDPNGSPTSLGQPQLR